MLAAFATFTAVTAITVAAAAFARLALLAFFLAFRTRLKFGGRHRSDRISRLVQTRYHRRVGGVETVSLGTRYRCWHAVSALATALVAPARAAFAPFASAFA